MRDTACFSMYSRHIDADHGFVVVEQVLGQRAHQFGFADAGGAQEDEAADGPVGIAQAGAVAQDGVRHQAHRFVLADHAVVQALRHLDQLLDFAFQHAGDRNAGPLGDDLGDILFVDLFFEQRVFLDGFQILLGRLDLLFDLRRAGRSGAARPFPNRRRGWPSPLPGASVSCSSLELRTRCDGALLAVPAFLQSGGLAAQASPVRSRRGAGGPARRRPFPCSAPGARSPGAKCGARGRRSRSAWSRSGGAARSRLRRSGRWPYRAGSGR